MYEPLVSAIQEIKEDAFIETTSGVKKEIFDIDGSTKTVIGVEPCVQMKDINSALSSTVFLKITPLVSTY